MKWGSEHLRTDIQQGTNKTPETRQFCGGHALHLLTKLFTDIFSWLSSFFEAGFCYLRQASNSQSSWVVFRVLT
jgi:hypothetical protein